MRLHLGDDWGALIGMMSKASSTGGNAAPSKATSSTAPRTAVTRPSIACVGSMLRFANRQSFGRLARPMMRSIDLDQRRLPKCDARQA
jgi:hypothetical protein